MHYSIPPNTLKQFWIAVEDLDTSVIRISTCSCNTSLVQAGKSGKKELENKNIYTRTAELKLLEGIVWKFVPLILFRQLIL